MLIEGVKVNILKYNQSMNKIFFSWQSDDMQAKKFLQDCINDAVSGLDDWEVEHATRDLVGSKDIGRSILDKIDKSDLFLADISIINPNSQDKKTPNPNVLYELGYAVARLTDDNIIQIANTLTTPNKDKEMPFDIRNSQSIYIKFVSSSKTQLTEEIRRIIGLHKSKKEMSGPYIYSGLYTRSIIGEIQLNFTNDEDSTYHLNSVQINYSEKKVETDLAPKKVVSVSIGQIGFVQADKTVRTMSFVVSRMGKSYRIVQKANYEENMDKQFQLESITNKPADIYEINERRDFPDVEEIGSTGGDYIAYKISDKDLEHSYILRISHTALATGGVNEYQLTNIINRAIWAVNDSLEGGIKDATYLITSELTKNNWLEFIPRIEVGILELKPI